MSKSRLTHSDLKRRYGEYPCPKCPPGYRLMPMKKVNGKVKKRKSLSDCKCIRASVLLGGARYLKELYKQYLYGKKRKWKRRNVNGQKKGK